MVLAATCGEDLVVLQCFWRGEKRGKFAQNMVIVNVVRHFLMQLIKKK
jgi:hypothetical protein